MSIIASLLVNPEVICVCNCIVYNINADGSWFFFQIYHEAKKFGKVYNINVVCAYGGGNLYEQCKACEEGAEIIVATPVSFSFFSFFFCSSCRGAGMLYHICWYV